MSSSCGWTQTPFDVRQTKGRSELISTGHCVAVKFTLFFVGGKAIVLHIFFSGVPGGGAVAPGDRPLGLAPAGALPPVPVHYPALPVHILHTDGHFKNLFVLTDFENAS